MPPRRKPGTGSQEKEDPPPAAAARPRSRRHQGLQPEIDQDQADEILKPKTRGRSRSNSVVSTAASDSAPASPNEKRRRKKSASPATARPARKTRSTKNLAQATTLDTVEEVASPAQDNRQTRDDPTTPAARGAEQRLAPVVVIPVTSTIVEEASSDDDQAFEMTQDAASEENASTPAQDLETETEHENSQTDDSQAVVSIEVSEEITTDENTTTPVESTEQDHHLADTEEAFEEAEGVEVIEPTENIQVIDDTEEAHSLIDDEDIEMTHDGYQGDSSPAPDNVSIRSVIDANEDHHAAAEAESQEDTVNTEDLQAGIIDEATTNVVNTDDVEGGSISSVAETDHKDDAHMEMDDEGVQLLGHMEELPILESTEEHDASSANGHVNGDIVDHEDEDRHISDEEEDDESEAPDASEDDQMIDDASNVAHSPSTDTVSADVSAETAPSKVVDPRSKTSPRSLCPSFPSPDVLSVILLGGWYDKDRIEKQGLFKGRNAALFGGRQYFEPDLLKLRKAYPSQLDLKSTHPIAIQRAAARMFLPLDEPGAHGSELTSKDIVEDQELQNLMNIMLLMMADHEKDQLLVKQREQIAARDDHLRYVNDNHDKIVSSLEGQVRDLRKGYSSAKKEIESAHLASHWRDRMDESVQKDLQEATLDRDHYRKLAKDFARKAAASAPAENGQKKRKLEDTNSHPEERIKMVRTASGHKRLMSGGKVVYEAINTLMQQLPSDDESSEAGRKRKAAFERRLKLDRMRKATCAQQWSPTLPPRDPFVSVSSNENGTVDGDATTDQLELPVVHEAASDNETSERQNGVTEAEDDTVADPPVSVSQTSSDAVAAPSEALLATPSRSWGFAKVFTPLASLFRRSPRSARVSNNDQRTIAQPTPRLSQSSIASRPMLEPVANETAQSGDSNPTTVTPSPAARTLRNFRELPLPPSNVNPIVPPETFAPPTPNTAPARSQPIRRRRLNAAAPPASPAKAATAKIGDKRKYVDMDKSSTIPNPTGGFGMNLDFFLDSSSDEEDDYVPANGSPRRAFSSREPRSKRPKTASATVSDQRTLLTPAKENIFRSYEQKVAEAVQYGQKFGVWTGPRGPPPGMDRNAPGTFCVPDDSDTESDLSDTDMPSPPVHLGLSAELAQDNTETQLPTPQNVQSEATAPQTIASEDFVAPMTQSNAYEKQRATPFSAGSVNIFGQLEGGPPSSEATMRNGESLLFPQTPLDLARSAAQRYKPANPSNLREVSRISSSPAARPFFTPTDDEINSHIARMSQPGPEPVYPPDQEPRDKELAQYYYEYSLRVAYHEGILLKSDEYLLKENREFDFGDMFPPSP